MTLIERDAGYNVAINSMPELFRLLESDKRRGILFELGLGPMNVSSLAQRLQCTEGSLRRHLSRLQDSGLIDATRTQRRLSYRLTSAVTVTHKEHRRTIAIDLGKHRLQLELGRR